MGIVTAQEMANKHCFILNVIYYVAIELSKINRFSLCWICYVLFVRQYFQKERTVR